MAAQHIVREIYQREIDDDGGGDRSSSSSSSSNSGGGSSGSSGSALGGATRQTIATKRSITLLFTLGEMVAEGGGKGGALYQEGLNLLDTALQLLHSNSNSSSGGSGIGGGDGGGDQTTRARPPHWPRAARIARAWHNSAYCLLMMSTHQGGVSSGPWRFSPPSGGQHGTIDDVPPWLDDVRRRLWESMKVGRRAEGNYNGNQESLAALRSLSLPEPPPDYGVGIGAEKSAKAENGVGEQTLMTYSDRLRAIYEVHNRGKLLTMEATLKKYAGREDYLFRLLKEKYGRRR